MKFQRFKDLDPSDKALNVIMEYLSNYYDMRSHIVTENRVGQCLLLENGEIAIALSTCKVPFHSEKVLKIEDIAVEEGHRNEGRATTILAIIKEVSNIVNCIIGLWCEDSTLEFYKSRGFRYVTTKKDHWLEYVPSKQWS